MGSVGGAETAWLLKPAACDGIVNQSRPTHLIMHDISLNMIWTDELYENSPQTDVMNREIGYRVENVLYQAVNVFIYGLQLGILYVFIW